VSWYSFRCNISWNCNFFCPCRNLTSQRKLDIKSDLTILDVSVQAMDMRGQTHKGELTNMHKLECMLLASSLWHSETSKHQYASIINNGTRVRNKMPKINIHCVPKKVTPNFNKIHRTVSATFTSERW